ncbi:MAG: hypothetical protein MKZ59_03665 [Deinococcales bacterium]|nr:hypothetical protein [Deinococcales bacterium]
MNDSKKTLTRRELLKKFGVAAAGIALSDLSIPGTGQAFAQGSPSQSNLSAVFPNSQDPVLSAKLGRDVRIPNTCPALYGQPNLHVGNVDIELLDGATSLLGHRIKRKRDPHRDLEIALGLLHRSARESGDYRSPIELAAREIKNILLGTTEGRVYDGFGLLNINPGKLTSDHVADEYKTKRLTDTGETVISVIDGQRRKVWHATINMFWYGHNFDSDTYLLRITAEVHPYDEFRITWRVYSLVQEDLAPSTITNDGFGLIFHGLDSTFTSIPSGTLSQLTINYPSVLHFRGMYTWGWGVHPPRVQFLQPIVEIDEDGTLNPAGHSFATRMLEGLTLENIAEESPEKKMYHVAEAALQGASGDKIIAMMTNSNEGPLGTYREWVSLASDQRQLPPEAWDVLRKEDGLKEGNFGPYDMVLAYMNNEIYGDTPYAQFGSEGLGGVVRDWEQGGLMRVKVINFDRHVHYYRNVDFGPRLTEENGGAFGNGIFSFEKFSPKPTYGAPKVAEMQWRTGWGYVPHLGIASQAGVFPRNRDQLHLRPFTDQFGQTHQGYLFRNVSGYFRFNPPDKVRAGNEIPAGDPLRDEDGLDGVKISLDAEAFGVAKIPDCTLTGHPDQANFADLSYPDFLRNPSNGGDIIPPTPIWSPFLVLHPQTGTLYTPEGTWWVDETYLHGRPVQPGSTIVATIEAPRASGQLFYQFDPLFHDNMIFSYHPRSDNMG